MLEEEVLLFDGHRVGEGLVSIAKISGEPDGRFGDHPRRPLSVMEFQGRIGLVLDRWVIPANESLGICESARQMCGLLTACT